MGESYSVINIFKKHLKFFAGSATINIQHVAEMRKSRLYGFTHFIFFQKER